MFWKLFVLAIVLWGVGMLTHRTFAGFIHVLPVGALICAVVHFMGKPPNSEFGRWRAGPERPKR